LGRHRALVATVKDRAADGTKVMVPPESALGYWTPTVERLWVNALEGTDITVIAGAAMLDAQAYDNVLIGLSAAGGKVIYRERMPVPGSMWQPWRSWIGESAGARAHLSGSPVAKVGDRRLAPLICYEQLLVWPLLQSMPHDPDLIVAVGNGWWTKGTSIVAIQRASTIAWAKLFAKPLVLAFNT
jgi:apolipoprotein N-acyltransferase